jgi:hypothetical protein
MIGWLINLIKFVEWVNEACMVLKGHRSIVNQVRYNPSYDLLASSGVEKMIKVSALVVLKIKMCHKTKN